MIIPVPSQNRRFKIKLGIRTNTPFALGVKCYDPTKPNTTYIRRRVPFHPELFNNKGEAYKEFTLPFPLSPELMLVELYDKLYGDDTGFKLEKFEIEELEPAEVWAEPEMHRFIAFAQDFARKAGYIPTGAYDSAEGEFLIQYLPFITDENGEKMITPARTNRKSGRIQVSQSDFRNYTIPVRMVVLFHERYHFQIPTRKEKPADLSALRLYLDMLFPKTEAVYAVSKIFTAHPGTVGEKHLDRVKDIINFIDSHTAQKQLSPKPA